MSYEEFTWIDCPEHLTHKVRLFTLGHRYAGIWECNESGEGISDSCPHFDHETEDDVEVCVLCKVQVDEL